MDLDVVDLIYYLRSYQQILKYINLKPKETTPLGSCIGTWNELLGKERKKKGKRSWRLSAQRSAPIPRALVRHLGVGLAPSFVRLIALSSVRLVGGSTCLGRSLVVGLCPLPLGFTLCRWALPFVVGFYSSSLGSTLRRWVPPLVAVLYPSSLGPTPRRWVLPSIVGFYPSMSWNPYRCRGTHIDTVEPHGCHRTHCRPWRCRWAMESLWRWWRGWVLCGFKYR